jgi:hypothetical protein
MILNYVTGWACVIAAVLVIVYAFYYRNRFPHSN